MCTSPILTTHISKWLPDNGHSQVTAPGPEPLDDKAERHLSKPADLKLTFVFGIRLECERQLCSDCGYGKRLVTGSPPLCLPADSRRLQVCRLEGTQFCHRPFKNRTHKPFLCAFRSPLTSAAFDDKAEVCTAEIKRPESLPNTIWIVSCWRTHFWNRSGNIVIFG